MSLLFDKNLLAKGVMKMIIKGSIFPYQAGAIPGQRFFNKGKWNLEYEIISNGNTVKRGRIQADTEGNYEIQVPGNITGYVRIRCLGGYAYYDDEVTVRIEEGAGVVRAPALHMREK